MRRLLGTSVVLAFVLIAMLPSAGQASFSGQNGKLLFTPTNSNCLSTVNPDGTGPAATPLCGTDGARFSPDGTHVAYNDRCIAGVFTAKLDGSDNFNAESAYPCELGQAWSPDGKRLVIGSFFSDSDHDYQRLFIINLTGGSYQFLIDKTCPPDIDCSFVLAPDWSPDGTKILYSNSGIFSISSAGGAPTQITGGAEPSWSPDGTKIAFRRGGDIYVMNADGSEQTNLTNSSASESRPIWSPDRRKIAFTSTPDGAAANNAVWTMNADGSGAVQVTGGRLADWQPIPYTGYARPKGATPFQTYLVPAYEPCSAPNSTHGSPLSFPSCSPPQPVSDFLTVGTADSNGEQTNSRGRVRYDALLDSLATPAVDEADMAVDISITDVRNKSDLSDYSGSLQQRLDWRITDKNVGTGGPGPVTVTDFDIPFNVPCDVTGDTTVGSTCAVTTSVDTLVPGAITGQDRTVVELSRLTVHDGGPDGDPATTPSENTLFMVPGLFIP